MDLFRDWFRTLLSLLGVCIGVFSIVSVFTCVDSLQSTIRESFENFGSDVVFIEKEPLEPDLNDDGVFKWWEYAGRRPVGYDEYAFLRQKSALSGQMAFTLSFKDVTGVCGDWSLPIKNRVSAGRAFSSAELESGTPVAIIGARVREEMEKNGDGAIGRSIRIVDRIFTVIGVFEEAGSSAVSLMDVDNSKVIPYRAAAALTNYSSARTSIAATPAEDVSEEEFIFEIKSLMRQIRRLPPGAKDDFAVNRLSFILSEVGEIFSLVNVLGWIIGIFSLLVGCFGVANIMFVSVQERIPEIGIQKALGAKRKRILLQFLGESSLLSVAGGASGILLVWLATLVIPAGTVELKLTLSNIVLGLAISLFTGIVAGLAPAVRASRLNPVDAISYK